MEVGGELSCADSTDPLHKPGAVIVAIDINDVVHSGHIRRCRKKLEVYKGHMVAEDHVRGLESLHIDLLHLALLATEHNRRQNANEACEI